MPETSSGFPSLFSGIISAIFAYNSVYGRTEKKNVIRLVWFYQTRQNELVVLNVPSTQAITLQSYPIQ